MAGDGSDSLPAMSADRGAAIYCQRLIDNVTADPTAPLAAERVAVAASLGVESPPLGQWWLEHAGPALGGPEEDAWLQIAVAFAAGRLLDFDAADTLALSDSETVAAATAAGVAPGPGSSAETRMITAILDGHCSDVAAPNTGVVADLVNALAPREFMALCKGGGRASFEMPSAHCTVALAPEKRRDAFRRLARVDGRLSKVQAAMNTARRSLNSVAPWSLAAAHLRDVYGPCWLAADIAIIGAAISSDRRRDVGPMNPTRRPFGPDVDYGRLVNDVRKHRRDGEWWRDQHDQLTPSDRAVWIYALVAVVDPQVVADCVDVVTEAVATLTTDELRVLMASSSRLGLSGISRRLPADLVATAVTASVPTALLIAHHADALSGMRSNLVDAFSAEQATDAATFGAAAWPALRAAGTALLDTGSPQWLEVLAAHGPHATARRGDRTTRTEAGRSHPRIAEIIPTAVAAGGRAVTFADQHRPAAVHRR